MEVKLAEDPVRVGLGVYTGSSAGAAFRTVVGAIAAFPAAVKDISRDLHCPGHSAW